MLRVLVFGNSGSGKSTLARQLVRQAELAHLDLDTLAWLPTTPPQRAPLMDSKEKIDKFMQSHNAWVVEGCYTDLLEFAAPQADEVIFMNLSVEQCVENAKSRPWEPHKYASKEAQDNNLEMLINWIKQYTQRKDEFSFESHMNFYKGFHGHKTMHTGNGIIGT